MLLTSCERCIHSLNIIIRCFVVCHVITFLEDSSKVDASEPEQQELQPQPQDNEPSPFGMMQRDITLSSILV